MLTYIALWFIREAAPILILITLALLLTAILDPLAGRLQRWGLGRGLASALSVIAVLVAFAIVFGIVLPPLITEGAAFIENLPELLVQWERWLARYPAIHTALLHRAERIRTDPAEVFTGFLSFGVNVVTAIFSAVLILTLTLYFLIDGRRVRESVLRHVPRDFRARVDLTITDVGVVVRNYFVGQAIVSGIFAAYAFVVLTILGVPYASVLAAIGFILDAIPNIGSLIATVLPALLALTKSVTTAIIVVIAFVVYQQVENNLISPRILGRQLRIPPLLTLIAILVGGNVLGVIGIIIAIPLAGALPVIDRIWITGEAGPGEAESEETGPDEGGPDEGGPGSSAAGASGSGESGVDTPPGAGPGS